MGNDRNRLALRMRTETAQKIEQWHKASNCRSKNEFIEKAVNFYADYLALNGDNQLLPKAVLSAIEGRLGLLEKNLSAVTFNHAVELDMLVGIIPIVVVISSRTFFERDTTVSGFHISNTLCSAFFQIVLTELI